jgi:acylpyruvate hydrolase
MKLTTFISNGQPRLGVIDGDSVIDLNKAQSQVPSDLRLALKAGVDLAAAGKAAVASGAGKVPLSSVTLAPMIPEPGKVICLGLNYFDHAKEGGREKPEYPWFFLRCASSLLAPNANAMLPKVSERFDYEAELAVIIGKKAKHLTQANALSCVFGYTCFNDMSVRDYQKKTPQWTIGKNFDSTGGFGPTIVTADELPEGATGLKIQCRLNGEVMQNANTTDMIWGVAETIALLTECMTLEPGDVIIMGTPAGVGQARKPPVWMKNGDVVEIDIEKIGILKNQIVAEAA